MTKYTIDVVSDTVCPWCYLGKKRMDAAITQHLASNPSDTFDIVWHPFQLNPAAPASMDKKLFFEQRFGAQRTKAMQSNLTQLGKEVGIDFAFGGVLANTRDSHRVMQLAKKKGGSVQNTLAEELYQSFFVKNENIGSPDVLASRGANAGLDAQETREFLASGGGNADVDRELRGAQQQGISGVPHYTINGQYVLGGAEEPAAFKRVFDSVKSKSSVEAGKGGETC